MNENAKKQTNLQQNYTWLKVTDDERLLLNTSHVAHIMGVSASTIGQWEAKGCPKEKRGWYDIRKVIAWRGRAVGIPGGPTAMADKMEADTRLKVARAAMAEQELKVKNGELISAKVVEDGLSEIFSNLKASMLGIADHVMTEIYSQYPDLAPQVRRLIDGYIRAALKDVADNKGKLTEPKRPAKRAVGRPKKRR